MADKSNQSGEESQKETQAKPVQSTESQVSQDQERIEEEETKEYLFLKGKFNYGGRTKAYGLISCILDMDTQELMRLDLLEKDENFEFRLESNLRSVAEFYRSQLSNYRSKKMAQQLSVNLTRDLIDKIFTAAAKDNLDPIANVFKENLEDILQESIRIEIVKEIISHQELKEIYPELFEESEEGTEEEAGTEGKTESEDVNDETGEEENKLDARIELKCSPIISAIRGRRITQLDTGDKLLVNITDKRNLGQDLSDLLQKHNGAAIGAIEEITYNENLDRYRVLVKFKRNIYGKLVTDPEVKLTVFNESEIKEPEVEENLGFKLDQEIILLFAGIGIIVILLIAIFLVM